MLKKSRVAMMSGYLGVLSLLAACSVPAPTTDQATSYATQYYSALQAGDVDKAVQLLGGDRPPEAWRDDIRGRLTRHGAVEGYSLGHVDVNTVYSGTLYVVEARVKYAQGPVTEILTMQQPVDRGELKIVAVRAEGEIR